MFLYSQEDLMGKPLSMKEYIVIYGNDHENKSIKVNTPTARRAYNMVKKWIGEVNEVFGVYAKSETPSSEYILLIDDTGEYV